MATIPPPLEVLEIISKHYFCSLQLCRNTLPLSTKGGTRTLFYPITHSVSAHVFSVWFIPSEQLRWNQNRLLGTSFLFLRQLRDLKTVFQTFLYSHTDAGLSLSPLTLGTRIITESGEFLFGDIHMLNLYLKAD